MARSNGSSDDPPAGGRHEANDDLQDLEGTNGNTRNGVPDPPGEDRSAAARRLHKIAGASHTSEGSAYQGAMEAALAVPISMGIGYWADGQFGTEPVLLIAGAVVGFAAMVVRLVRMRSLVGDSEDPASHDTSRDDREQ